MSIAQRSKERRFLVFLYLHVIIKLETQSDAFHGHNLFLESNTTTDLKFFFKTPCHDTEKRLQMSASVLSKESTKAKMFAKKNGVW